MSVHPIYLPSGAKAKVKPKADLFPSIYKPRSEVEVEPKSVQESKVEIENQPASHTGTDTKARADQCIAEGKKAIALKQWEEGVNKYAEALDLMRQLVGDFDPQMAPLLLSYGKALYELAFSQQGVMGREEIEKEVSGSDVKQAGGVMDPPNSKNFVFEADPVSDDEDDENENENDNADTSLAQTESGQAEAGASSGVRAVAGGAAELEAEGEDEEVDEPEDDYNAAWEVLDVARTIYLKVVGGLKEGEGRETRLLLAECYIALGDVSCETENFPNAVQDYKSALSILTDLHPASSRTLTSTHYQLATALEFVPSSRAEALSHVQSALSGFQLRLKELTSNESATVGGEPREERYKNEKEREEEIKDVKSLIGDLEVKIEELKTAPENGDLVSESIEHLLGTSSGGAGSGSNTSNGLNGKSNEPVGPVNDLTSMVRKKVVKPKTTAQSISPLPQAQASASISDGNSNVTPKDGASLSQTSTGMGTGTKTATLTVTENGVESLEKGISDSIKGITKDVQDDVGTLVKDGKEVVGDVLAGVKRKANEVGESVGKKLKGGE